MAKFMKNKAIRLLLLTVLLATLLSIVYTFEAAAEEDYHWKFIVPVELKNMHPEAKTFNVSVFVKNDKDEQLGDSPVVVVNIPAGGNYSGNVEVKIKASPGKDPFTATNYEVVMFINNTQPSPNSSNIWAKPKEGTVFVPIVKGQIPK